MTTYPHLRARLFNRPLLVTPERARQLVSAFAARDGLAARLVLPDPGPGDAAALDIAAMDDDGWRGPAKVTDRPLYPVAKGIAVVTVAGTLVAKLGTMDPYSGMTGYDGLIAKIDTAAADPSVRGIMLDMETPGGEVHSSLFECARAIRQARAAKPVWAVCSDYSYSAGFWLASQADRIVVPPTGGVGSVGVVCMHADFSRMLDEDGITVTLIHAGAHKVDGNPYQPLPDSVRADIQADIDDVRMQFAEAVADGRGLTVDAVLATEARALGAADAVDADFADAILTPDDAFAAFVDDLAGASVPAPAASAAHTAKEKGMAHRSTAPRGANAATRSARRRAEEDEEKREEGAAEDEEKREEGAAAAPEDEEDAAAEGEDEDASAEGDDPADDEEDKDEDSPAASGERRRIAAILQSPEAAGRKSLAEHLALHTSLSAKEARAVLKASPKAAGLADAMAAIPNADVGSGAVKPAAGNHGWDRAVAKVEKFYKGA